MGLSLSSFLKLFEKKKNTFEKQNNPTHTNSNPIATPGLLTLDISSQHVQLYSASPENISNDALRVAAEVMTPGNDLPHTPFIRLLSGTLAEFLQYSGADASRWLINTAHDLCDPKHRRGSLYILRGEEWVLVVDADPLTASQYLYHLGPGVTVGLSKISRRAGRSRTSTIGNASTMANHVMQRDGKCWVTRARRILINSHICPKRMGDHTARNILRTFTTLDPSADVSIFDEIFGLNLISYLDGLFDVYELGFYYISPGLYECHVFANSDDEDYTVVGVFERGDNCYNYPLLHGQPASPPQPHSHNLPPAGLFRWHYMQCVIRRFGHDNYKDLPNIYLFEFPLRMEGDSDDNGTDSEAQWPSMLLDLGRDAESAIAEHAEHQQAVQKWRSLIT